MRCVVKRSHLHAIYGQWKEITETELPVLVRAEVTQLASKIFFCGALAEEVLKEACYNVTGNNKRIIAA